MTYEELAARWAKEYEGFRDKPYLCPAGKITVGWGTNVEALGLDVKRMDAALAAAFMETRWPESVCETLFQRVFRVAIVDAREFVGGILFEKLSTVRQAVLVDMAYNMGRTSLWGFKNFRAALKDYDWERAAAEMMDSKWYQQVGRRSKAHVERMRTGALE